ncbi:MAG: dTMP kinase [Paraclostridium sp.]
MCLKTENAKIIVIDGCDGTGKETQSKLLVQYLESIGKNVKLISFPNYSSDSSLLVRKFLNKELEMKNPFQRTMAYALDRSITMSSPEIVEFLKDPNGVIVCDRYVSASLIYDTVDTPNDLFVDHVIANENIEYTLLDIPRPDITFLFNLDIDKVKDVLNKRKDSHGKIEEIAEQSGRGNDSTPDIYESDLSFMNKIVNNIMRLGSIDGMTVINCNNSLGERYTVEEIHTILVEEVNKLFI